MPEMNSNPHIVGAVSISHNPSTARLQLIIQTLNNTYIALYGTICVMTQEVMTTYNFSKSIIFDFIIFSIMDIFVEVKFILIICGILPVATLT